MFNTDNNYQTTISAYIKTIYKTISSPVETFETLELNTYQLVTYLVLSAWVYAVIGNLLKSYSVFVFLLFAPLSVIPHSFLIALTLYLIFGKLYRSKTTFKKCFKISSYMLITSLPIMSITCIPFHDNLITVIIKSLPFIYFVYLLYKATSTCFNNVPKQKIISGNVLANLLIFFISTIIFTINMAILLFICENILHFNYIWQFHYNK